MVSLKKFFKLYLRFWSVELQRQLVFQPLMAFFSYLAHAGWIALSYVFLLVIISAGMANKAQLELLLFLSYFHSVRGLFWIYSSWSSAFLAGSGFREGKIDFWLLKPLPSQWLISSFRPNIFALTDFLVGIASFIYFLYRLNILNWISMGVFVVSTPLSAIVLYSVWFSYLTLFVPSGEASATHGMMALLCVFGEYPNRIYSGINKIITTVVFPTVIITTLPMSIFLGQKGISWIFVLVIAAALGLLISHKLWQRMLRFYTSAN